MTENEKKACLKKAAIEPDFDDAVDMILEAYDQVDSQTHNIIPNVPEVRAILGDFKYTEIGLWIVVKNLPGELYVRLNRDNLFPYYGYYQRFTDFLRF